MRKPALLFLPLLLLSILLRPAAGQSVQSRPSGGTAAPAAQTAPPAAVIDLQSVLTMLEHISRQATVDIAALRIDKWKVNGEGKEAARGNADSIQRNMNMALPGMISAVRTAPADTRGIFKLYRNVSALYDVLNTLAESAGAFGSDDEFQILARHAATLDKARLALASSFEQLLAAKETELERLKGGKSAATGTTAKPKRIIVDDSAPAKKRKR